MCKNVLPAYSSAKIIFKNQTSFFRVMITNVLPRSFMNHSVYMKFTKCMIRKLFNVRFRDGSCIVVNDFKVRSYGQKLIHEMGIHLHQSVRLVLEYHFKISLSVLVHFLANVNSRSRSLYAIARPSVCRLSVVCNVRAPYSGG